MNVNTATVPGWRLVHDGITVIALFESAGVTESIFTIFEAQTEQACLDEIARLGLVAPADLASG